MAKEEKEKVSEELEETIQELGRIAIEHEACPRLVEEGVASAKQEAEAARAEVEELKKSHDAAAEELKASKDDLVSQLKASSGKVTVLQAQLDEARSNHLRESDRARADLRKMCDLVESTSLERDAARAELEECKSRVEELTKSNDASMSEVARLEDEAARRQSEIEALNGARRTFEAYEEESKAEIRRLRAKLAETTSDILRSVQSGDSAGSSGVGGGSSGGRNQQEKPASEGQNAGGSRRAAPALPSLVDEASVAPTVISVVEEAAANREEMLGLRESLSFADKERDALQCRIEALERERDALLAEVRGLRDQRTPYDADDGVGKIKGMEDEIATLRSSLARAEEAYVSVEVEKCERVGAIAEERDELASQVKSLKATLLLKGLGEKAASEVARESDQLRDQLDTQLKVNEQLSVELTTLRDRIAKSAPPPSSSSSSGADLHGRLDAQIHENASLALEIATLRATADSATILEGKVGELQERLDAQAKENEQLSSEVSALRATIDSTSEIEGKVGKLQEQLDAQLKENDRLSSEVTVLRAASARAGGDMSAAIQVSKEIEEIKQEHRIEVKLLKKEQASLKTQVKLFAKEKEELAEAFETERLSNNELETSLDEIVELLESERAIHGAKAQEYKLIKKKFNAMRKKRIPIDAAYKACRVLLERLEGRLNREEQAAVSDNGGDREVESRNIGHEVSNIINFIDGLARALGDQESGWTPKSSSVAFSSDDEQMKTLAGKCEILEKTIREMKLKIASFNDENNELKGKIDALRNTSNGLEDASVQTPFSLGDSSSLTDTSSEQSSVELGQLREANRSLKEKSKHLTKELIDSTKAFEETITSYEAVIAKVKTALSDKKQENETLKGELNQAKKALTDLETKSVEDSSKGGERIANLEKIQIEAFEAHDEEINKYRETVESLNKKLGEGNATIEALERDKAKLRLEVGRLKSDFSEVISQFEQELTASCEASEAALQEKQEECESIKEALHTKEKEHKQLETRLATAVSELDKLRKELANFEGNDRESGQLILDLRRELSQKEADVQELHAITESTKEESRDLQNKLKGVMLSLDENIKLYQEHERTVQQHERTIKDLRHELKETQSEKKELASFVHKLEGESQKYQSEVNLLQTKLDAAMQSVEEKVQFTEQLRTECTSLKDEKETVLEKNSELSAKIEQLSADIDKLNAENETAHDENHELTAKIASLTGENGSLRMKMEKQGQSVDFIENQLGSIRDEVRAAEEGRLSAERATKIAEEGRQKAEKATEGVEEELRLTVAKLDDLTARNDDQEKKIDSLREEVRIAKDARQKALRTVDETQVELKRANTKIDSQEKQLERLNREIALAEEAHRKAVLAAGETEQDLLKATARLDEMITYSQKLKADSEETIASLKQELKENMSIHEIVKADYEESSSSLKQKMEMEITSLNEVIQSLQRQVKSVESDKEENRRMYEKDISLQQAVSRQIIICTALVIIYV